MDLKAQNHLLKEALKYLLWTKDYKDTKGKDDAYETHRGKAWKKAKEIIDACDGENSTEEKALNIHVVSNCANYTVVNNCRKATTQGCVGCRFNNEF